MSLGPWASGYTTTYKRYVRPVFCYQANTTLTMVAARVYLIPIEIERKMTVDRICVPISTPVAGNIRACIYADNGDTPVGGALIVESASVAKGNPVGRQEIVIVDTTLEAGLYWVAVQSDESTTVLISESDSFSMRGTLKGEFYDIAGGYGAFTNPCPGVGEFSGATVILSLRVKSLARPA